MSLLNLEINYFVNKDFQNAGLLSSETSLVYFNKKKITE